MIRFAAPCAALLAVAPAPTAANSLTLANELGSVLGSEAPCGLRFDPEAIDAWIEANVAADDMGFAGMMGMMARGQELQIADMTESQKRAHCAQTARVARSFGFIAE